MEQKNFWLFIILSLLILLGWTYWQRQLQPPAKQPQDKATQKTTEKPKPPPVKDEPQQALPWSNDYPENQAAAAVGLLAASVELLTAGGPTIAVGQLDRLFATGSAPSRPEHAIALGGDGYHLSAMLTTRGGGIRSLTLRRFQEASIDGTPLPEPLELIPDDPFKASFLLNHYPQAGNEAPVSTLGDAPWQFEGRTEIEDGQEVRLSTVLPEANVRLTRVYTLHKKDYHIGLTVEIKDTRTDASKTSPPFQYQLAGAHGVPVEGVWYTSTHRNAMIGMVDSTGSLWRELEDSTRISFRAGGDRVPQGNREGGFVQYAAVCNQYFASAIAVSDEQPKEDKGGGDMKSILAYARPTQESREERGRLDFLGTDVIIVMLPSTRRQETYRLLPRTVAELKREAPKVGDEVIVNAYTTPQGQHIATSLRVGQVPQSFRDDITVRVVSEPLELKPGQVRAHSYVLYHGPIKAALLAQASGAGAVDSEKVTRYTHTLHLRTLTDYRSAGPFGWFSQKIMMTDLIILCTRLMHWLLWLLSSVVINEGLTIILLTVLVRGAMFPVSRRQAMISIRMGELAPEMKKLQEKYKNDPQAKTQATMELYRKHGVNPLGGCLPILLQMPVFLGLYFALQESIRFREAGFLWIDSLAAPDMLIPWGRNIPWISHADNIGGFFYLGPYFNLLPVLAVVFMVIQQKLMMPPPTDEQQEMQQKMMKYMMLFMGFMFYKVASGLCIYFIASSVWGLAERRLLPKRNQPPSTAGVPDPSSNGGPARPAPKGRKGKKDRKEPEEETSMTKLQNLWKDILKQAKKK